MSARQRNMPLSAQQPEANRRLISYLLGRKEWQSFECKRAKIEPSKLLGTVVAFANSEGGAIVIGLEDPDKASDHHHA
jgi:predicted HTH transcriptional regulator